MTLTETASVERTAAEDEIVHYACCQHDEPALRPVQLLCGKDATHEQLREDGGQVCVVCEDDAKRMMRSGGDMPCPVERRPCPSVLRYLARARGARPA